MNVIGIICELNPPHLGHKHLFDFAREIAVSRTENRAEDSAVVAVMSGNFVQRGEPAIFTKHRRTAAALMSGVDLVLELPLPYALSSAEGFAAAGVAILNATGAVDTLAFGAECGNIELLSRAAAALELPECIERLQQELKSGKSYARACQAALEATLGEVAAVLESPNNMLGIQYLRAISTGGSKMDAICIKREPGIAASGLRNALRGGEKAPEGMLAADYGEPIFPKNLEIAMLSRIRAPSNDAYFKAPGASDGIAERALRLGTGAGSIEELAQAIKTKRHTLSRVRRYLMCLALGITDDYPITPPYIRILGANETGRELLKSMDVTLPIITKSADGRRLGGEVQRMLELEAASTDFYKLGYKTPELRQGGAEWRISPVML